MNKLTKTILGAVALMAGVAYAATSAPALEAPARAAADGTVTATWAMNNFADLSATVSDASALDVALEVSEGLDPQKNETPSLPTGSFTVTKFNFGPTEGGLEDDQYLTFTITPKAEITPAAFSFNMINLGWGDGRFALYVDGEQLAKDVDPGRSDKNQKDVKEYTYTYDLSSVGKTSEPIEIKLYLYSRNAQSSRGIGLGNVVFTATTGEGGSGDDPDPDPKPGDDVEVPAGWLTIPGDLNFNDPSWVLDGLRNEGGNNIGYAKDGCSATAPVFVKEQGVYNFKINFNWFKSACDFIVDVTDRESGIREAHSVFHVTQTGTFEFMLEGLLTVGKKDIKYTFSSPGNGSYLANYTSVITTKVGDKYAVLRNVTIEGVENTGYEGFDWAFNIPTNAGETTTLKADFMGATLTAKMDGTDVAVAEDGTIVVPTPAPNTTSTLNLTLLPEEGVASSQTEFAVRLYRLGDVVLTGLKVAGDDVDADVIKALNDNAAATLTGRIYTALPAATASFVDGTTVAATVTRDGDNAIVKFTGTAGSLTKDFTLTAEGLHIYAPAEGDLTDKIVFDAANNQPDNTWSNGLYTISPCNDGWGGTQFKFKGNQITVTAPNDMKVKQFTMAKLFDNYVPGKITSVTSEGATVWMPTHSTFLTNGNENAYDLVCTVENHTPGNPFVITIEGGSQPVMWFEFAYEVVKPTDAPTMQSVATTPLEGRNHAVVSFTFNRAMNDATITVNGKEIKALGGGAVLSFPIWDLPWNTDVDVTIPAGSASDTYGNATAQEYKTTLEVGAPATVEPLEADRFVEVSNAAELRAAVAALSTTNNTASAATTIIFMRNGDYDLGTEVLHLNKLYNVSLIGESQDGVLLHGTKTGISDPTFSTRYSTNIYMENFTSRNDLDFGKERVGVGVAHYGGNLDIMKNVTLQSIQDTQVTGERGYYVNCTIHGSVDYMCGGGDHYYDHCTIKHDIAGGYITAPSTSASLLHGYVFQGCTITGKGDYSLGRPWQNEPRCFWLNTTMEALPNDRGWGPMGNLVTHFFEYNSMDKDGNPLDLSVRGNSPSSTNTYSPILPEEYADYFTPQNVLGGKDSWLATDLTAECAAPVVTVTPEGTLDWEAVDGAAAYLVFNNGAYVGMTPTAGYVPAMPAMAAPVEAPATPSYTVAAINGNGARGVMSDVAKDSSGVENVLAGTVDDNVEYYTLQGVRTDASTRGAVIRVTTDANGNCRVEKIVK